ncbi:pectinesterase family protein [Lysobacter cavernae]|uniref:Pectinesterase n=1 Tax=Lysobacter cavernae TaxID=1685901 RepID=A0ABV7RME7_9GAMM
MRLRSYRTCLLSALLPGMLAAVPATAAQPQDLDGPVIVVAADGSGDYTTVQAAVDAAPAYSSQRVTVLIEPGVYPQPLTIPASKPNLTLAGASGNARDVIISCDRSAGTSRPDGGTYGTSGSACVVISGNDTHSHDLTYANTYDRLAHPENTGTQAVAVRTTGDRLVFGNVRFLGHQDTLYANSPSDSVPARQYYRNCYIEGDVDFVFGRGTAVFDGCEIRSLDRGSTSNNGFVTAPSTPAGFAHGFLITRSCFTSDAPPATVYLGRPWVPSSNPLAQPQVLIRNSWLGRQFRQEGWVAMTSNIDWRNYRLGEYRNFGPGALVTIDRPQMDDEEAALHTPQAYLAGNDGWNPVPPGPPAPPVCRARGQ